MHRIAIKTRLAVQVGYLYKRRNAERDSVHFTEPPSTLSTGC